MKLAVIALSILLSGCASKLIKNVVAQKDYKAEEVAKVKRVAIVAFEVGQIVPSGLAGKAIGSVSQAQMMGNIKAIEHELAQQLYASWSDKLKAKRSFEVIPAKNVISNPTYIALAVNQRHKSEGAARARDDRRALIIGSMMRPLNAEYMFEEAEIQKLAAALKVDAVIMAQNELTTVQNDLTGLGLGSIYLGSSVRFTMFNSKGEKVWYHRNFEGPLSSESLGKVSGAENTEKIEKLSRPVADEAIDAFLKI